MSSTAPTVLVIDDEVQIRRFLQSGFGAAGFSVREAKTAGEGIGSVMLRPPDLIILDLGLPDMDGAEVLQRIRSWSDVPVIILSGRASEDEKVRLLDLGADDYVVKPFGMAELVARGRTAMRRQQRTTNGETLLKLGRVTFDFATRSVLVDDRRISLTHKEYQLLQVLAQHAGNVLTHQHLLKEVWGTLHLNDMHERSAPQRRAVARSQHIERFVAVYRESGRVMVMRRAAWGLSAVAWITRSLPSPRNLEAGNACIDPAADVRSVLQRFGSRLRTGWVEADECHYTHRAHH